MKLPTVVALVDLPDAEWRLFMDTVRAAQSMRTAEKRAEFSYGDAVTFVARGMRWRGTVTKFNRKTVEVNCSGRRWRVSPGLLQKATEKVPA